MASSNNGLRELCDWVDCLNNALDVGGYDNHLELRRNKSLSDSHPRCYEVNWTGNRDIHGRYKGIGANRLEFVSGDDPSSLCKTIDSLVDSNWFHEEAKEMNGSNVGRLGYSGYKGYLSADSMNKRLKNKVGK